MPGPEIDHLRMLRVSSSGASDNLAVFDWPSPVYDIVPGGTRMITNADTGILLTWEAQTPSGEWEFHMAITSGTSVNVLNGPTGNSVVTPVLQAQDGSFVGTAYVWESGDPFMVAFDAAGNVRWTVAGNYQPQIATADGGVIATDESGMAVTFDQNGNATGQMGDFAAYSWFGNSYVVGSVDQVSASLVDLADSFWAFAQGNASGSGTANRPLAKTLQQLVAQKALAYVGSHAWVGQGVSCNLFVKKVLEDAGQAVPYSTNWVRRMLDFFGLLNGPLYYPALAGDWASRSTALGCWHNVTSNGPHLGPNPLPADLSRPGDIIAEAINYSNASGHVGIVVGPHQTASADSAAACVSPGTPAEIIDITDYGFRADGSIIVNQTTGELCSANGWKSKAVVKRFVCQ